MMITVSEFAQEFKIGLNKARELSRRDDFPSIKLGRRVLINKNMLEEWFNAEKEKQQKD